MNDTEHLQRLRDKMRSYGGAGYLQSHVALDCRQVAEAIAVLIEARGLIERYRQKTPLGHQPHMIAHKADEWLARIDALGRTENDG